MEKKIRVDYETPKLDPKRSVFVGNLPFHLSDEKVWAFFDKRIKSDDGETTIENVRLIRDRESGLGKGFGYVVFRTPNDAAKALTLHESKLDGREIRVFVCGKRFKNKKGDDDNRLKHEGLRASVGARGRIELKKELIKSQHNRQRGGKELVGGKKKTSTAKGAMPIKSKPFKKHDKKQSKKKNSTTYVKPKKPKHAARKARQAAEAAANKTQS